MIAMRCQCGKETYFHSGMPPRDCQGCTECGTTYASHPNHHKPLAPHTPKARYSSDTGELKGYRCAICYEKCEGP